MPPPLQDFDGKKVKTLPASPEHASALPGDIGDDWAHICIQFRQHPLPGSPRDSLRSFQVLVTWLVSAPPTGADERQIGYVGAADILLSSYIS